MQPEILLEELLVGQVLILEMLLTMESRVTLPEKDFADRKDHAIELLVKHHERVAMLLSEARTRRGLELT